MAVIRGIAPGKTFIRFGQDKVCSLQDITLSAQTSTSEYNFPDCTDFSRPGETLEVAQNQKATISATGVMSAEEFKMLFLMWRDRVEQGSVVVESFENPADETSGLLMSYRGKLVINNLTVAATRGDVVRVTIEGVLNDAGSPKDATDLPA